MSELQKRETQYGEVVNVTFVAADVVASGIVVCVAERSKTSGARRGSSSASLRLSCLLRLLLLLVLFLLHLLQKASMRPRTARNTAERWEKGEVEVKL